MLLHACLYSQLIILRPIIYYYPPIIYYPPLIYHPPIIYNLAPIIYYPPISFLLTTKFVPDTGAMLQDMVVRFDGMECR
jgi:hypothetical protein